MTNKNSHEWQSLLYETRQGNFWIILEEDLKDIQEDTEQYYFYLLKQMQRVLFEKLSNEDTGIFSNYEEREKHIKSKLDSADNADNV